jgi:predicted nucleic-acid-binding protein
MITLDTSALVRFFTNDIPGKARKVRSVIEKQKSEVPDVVFPELEYVLLGKTYNSTRENLVKAFEYLLDNKNVKVSREVRLGVHIYKKCNLDIADCIIVASAHRGDLLSFDNEMNEAHKGV